MKKIIRSAESVYWDKDSWDILVKRTMKMDFSWQASAEKYIKLYESML